MRFLITAGPTREPIDPVRYISNRSSGKMGYAIAEAAIEAGHEATLISGPVCVDLPSGARLISVSRADEMFDAVQSNAAQCDVCVMCAAVADYKPATVATQKIKKHDERISLDLVRTRDILAALGKQDRQFLLVGFAAETNDLNANAQKKLREKNCDIIVANDAGGMESDENEVVVFFKNGEEEKIPRGLKKNVARELVKIFSKHARKMFDKKNEEIT